MAMLESNARRAPGYWIQLTLALGIATLGLILDSTAVVIGAMLVSPLMGPIVELGMGFAVGSSLLTLRAAFRVVRSVLLVVVGAALVTRVLPFHEMTGEIAARTTPTALDLMVAICCALTAAYTTVRTAADTTAAAAGTAIGIALVPPLCVVGYGIGTGAADVATGAALLFTANFSAIVVLTVLTFLVLGYNAVDAARLEAHVLAHAPPRGERAVAYLHRALGVVFGSRYGLAIRLGVPAIFLALVAVPLARALDEVTWEVRARTTIRRLLATDAPRAVQTAVTVARHQVMLRVIVVGSSATAARLEQHLRTRIASRLGGSAPDVAVTAVADARSLAEMSRRARTPDAAPPVAPPRVRPAPPIADLRTRVDSALAARWPTVAAGPIVAWNAEVAGRSADSTTGPASGPLPPVEITVRHIGVPIGPAGEAILASALAADLGAPTRVTTVTLPRDPIVAPPREPTRWLRAVRPVLSEIARTPGVWACLAEPAHPAARVARRVIASSAVARAGRLVVAPGPRWALRVARGACPAIAPERRPRRRTRPTPPAVADARRHAPRLRGLRPSCGRRGPPSLHRACPRTGSPSSHGFLSDSLPGPSP